MKDFTVLSRKKLKGRPVTLFYLNASVIELTNCKAVPVVWCSFFIER